MNDFTKIDPETAEPAESGPSFPFRDPVSRRSFIKGVIASGAVVAGSGMVLGSLAVPPRALSSGC
jgi:hypothetical protein